MTAEGKARAKGKAETEEKARERKVQANWEESKGETNDSAGRAAGSDTSNQNVDGESLRR